MIILLLWLLATIDAAFIGYREAAGRNALINKRTYYQKAMLRGAFLGQIAIALAGSLIATAIGFSSEPSLLISELQQVAGRMLSIYLPYAFIILFTFALRLIPSVDVKSITSTVVFGPFTLLRPFLAIAGMIYGFLAATKMIVFFLGGLILILMLSLEWIISRLRAQNLISKI